MPSISPRSGIPRQRPSGAARLDIAASRIELVKERLTVKVELGRVADAFAAATQAARLFPALPRSSRDLAPPTGRARDVTAYLPLETDLPRIYGVGPGSLPDTADAQRQAQANQLRGYLALFDQLLANEYAQLGQLASLFSAADGSPRRMRESATPMTTGSISGRWLIIGIVPRSNEPMWTLPSRPSIGPPALPR